jgi:hypothetical protein
VTQGREQVVLRCRADEEVRCVRYYGEASHSRSLHEGGESDEDWTYSVQEGDDGTLQVERTGTFAFATDPPLPETVDALYASDAFRVSDTTPPL